MCGRRSPGCCRSLRRPSLFGLAGLGDGSGIGCFLRWRSCLTRWPGSLRFVAVIEDVHWADGATLDCLTYLARAGGSGALTVVVTCRGDEVPLDAQVTGWLAHARGAGGVEEIRLGPLSRAEAAQQIAGLVGEEPPSAVRR